MGVHNCYFDDVMKRHLDVNVQHVHRKADQKGRFHTNKVQVKTLLFYFEINQMQKRMRVPKKI